MTPSRKRRWRRLRRRIGASLASTIAPPVIRLLSWTWRFELLDRHHFDSAFEGGVLGAIWHGNMLHFVRPHLRQGFRALVSPSGDGELIARVLRRLGFGLVRGSSNRRGAAALRELLTAVRAGGHVVITPDGPRGPRHSVDTGLCWLARESGRAIVPGGAACVRAWRSRSWDRFTVPKPWTRVAICYGPPLAVPKDTPDDELEAIAGEVRRRMLDAEQRACDHLGVAPDSA